MCGDLLSSTKKIIPIPNLLFPCLFAVGWRQLSQCVAQAGLKHSPVTASSGFTFRCVLQETSGLVKVKNKTKTPQSVFRKL